MRKISYHSRLGSCPRMGSRSGYSRRGRLHTFAYSFPFPFPFPGTICCQARHIGEVRCMLTLSRLGTSQLSMLADDPCQNSQKPTEYE